MMRGRLVALGMVLISAGCVPPGAGEYRPPALSAPSVEPEPQPVFEQPAIIETPSWSPAVVARNAKQVATSVYVVQPGDSLFAIASKTGAGATVIAATNGLVPPYTLRVGDRLEIPGGLYHRVGAGETGIAIARAYDARWADIVALNALQPPFTLQVGQNLLLPSSQPQGRDSPEGRAAAFNLNIDDIVTGGNPATSSSPPRAAPKGFGGRFAWPVNGTILRRFGSQGGGRVNDGLNIAAPYGASVRAAAAGTVVYSGNEIGVFGGLVLIDHGGGWITAYGHLGSLKVAKGQKVSTGQSVGGVGDTGYVTQPQLHFEIRKDRKALNPLSHLPVADGKG